MSARLDREGAIKFIRREDVAPAQLEPLLKRFEREAKALAQLFEDAIAVNDDAL